jgi:hypothetical protein
MKGEKAKRGRGRARTGKSGQSGQEPDVCGTDYQNDEELANRAFRVDLQP